MVRSIWGILALASVAAAGTVPVGHLLVDQEAFLSRNDVVYLSPAREGWEGLPLGNGRLGAQLWHPDGLVLQLNTPLSGVYGGAIARLRLGADSQGGSLFRGRLSEVRVYDRALAPAELRQAAGLDAPK